MVQPIMHDPDFLAIPSAMATPDDLQVAQDLLDTLSAHAEGCVGMAANMIGVSKRIIAFENSGNYMVMFNPEIVKKSARFETQEGCLSLNDKVRPVTRYAQIKVEYQNEKFQKRVCTFRDWPAQIIQHEIDHCNGVLI